MALGDFLNELEQRGLVHQVSAPELAEALRRRLELYRAGRPYTLPITP